MEADHVVKLYDVKEEKDGYYLFMEMCDIDLGKLIKEKCIFIHIQPNSPKPKPWTSFDNSSKAMKASINSTSAIEISKYVCFNVALKPTPAG